VVHFRLHEPVGTIARRCPTVEVGASLETAVRKMREAGIDVLPVTQEQALVGVLDQRCLFNALAEGVEATEDVAKYTAEASTILSSQTGAEALRCLEATNFLVVVDSENRVSGLLSPAMFFGLPDPPERPSVVGGMATPLGVYLTNGSVRGGKKDLALLSTGAFLFMFFMVGRFVSLYLAPRLPESVISGIFLDTLPVLALIITFRFLPIAGYHGAEHQVVHALEQGEELTPEVVSRMPRVHPRCGTNLAVGATMFLSIQQTPWVENAEIRLLVAMIVTLFFWRPIGSFVQQWITTRKPTAKELKSGIDAGNELLRSFAVADRRQASPFRKIFNSGMLHVMSGSILAYVLVSLIAMLFGVEFGAL
jgi:hypothetical protein